MSGLPDTARVDIDVIRAYENRYRYHGIRICFQWSQRRRCRHILRGLRRTTLRSRSSGHRQTDIRQHRQLQRTCMQTAKLTDSSRSAVNRVCSHYSYIILLLSTQYATATLLVLR